MNIQRIFSLRLLVCAFFLHNAHALVQTTTNLAGAATTTAFHKKTGVWFIGSTAAAADDIILSYVGPVGSNAAGPNTETLNPTVVGGAAGGSTINLLALSDEVPYNVNNIRAVFVSSDNPDVLACGGENGTNTTLTPVTGHNILGLTAGSNNWTGSAYAFIAVGGDAQAAWGVATSGIGIVTVANTSNALALVGGATLPFAATSNFVTNNTNAATITGNPVLHWNSDLSRLYVGIQAASNGTNGSAVLALSIFRTNGNAVAQNFPIINNTFTALNTGADTDHSNIIGCNIANGQGATNYSVLALDTMKTSTGHNYLIVQGGKGVATAAPKQQIFALPLVDADGDYPGTLAMVTNTTTGLTSFKKTAIANTHLFTETVGGNPSVAMVGGNGLPINVGVANNITQMMAIGDAVYCSVQTSVAGDGTADQGGIFYSQAIFNSDGSIGGWTAWAKALPSSSAIGVNGCNFFAVDAIEGKIWTIPNAHNTHVLVSRWEQPTTQDTLVGSVNALLNGPCYSQLNLHQQVVNFGNNQKSRVALFGGNNTVVAVVTGSAAAGAGYKAVEVPTADWTVDTVKAVSVSLGLEKAGAVTALGWTNQGDNAQDSYVLAGTNGGLYALVQTTNSAGANLQFADLATNAAPCDGTYSWKALTAITDPVVSILSMQGTTTPVTFVLTQGTTHKLWRLSAATKLNLADLNATATLVWESSALNNTGNLPSFFYGMSSVMVTNNATASTLVISTDKGLYIADDVTKNDATQIAFAPLNLPNVFNPAHSLFTPLRTLANQDIYCVGNFLGQAPGGGWAPRATSALASINFGINPSQQYQPNTQCGGSVAAGYRLLAPSAYIKSFYTDGGRRFWIEQIIGDSKDGNTLHIIPFYIGTNDYNQTEVDDLPDTVIGSSKTFYWVNEMGAGYIMAGTDTGVIALQ